MFNDEILSILGDSLSNILSIKSISYIIYVFLYCWNYILFILFCLFIFASLSLKLFFTSVDKHVIYNEDSAGCPHDIFSATYLILDVHSVIDPPDIPLLTSINPLMKSDYHSIDKHIWPKPLKTNHKNTKNKNSKNSSACSITCKTQHAFLLLLKWKIFLHLLKAN